MPHNDMLVWVRVTTIHSWERAIIGQVPSRLRVSQTCEASAVNVSNGSLYLTIYDVHGFLGNSYLGTMCLNTNGRLGLWAGLLPLLGCL